jgi:hypothetical protein
MANTGIINRMVLFLKKNLVIIIIVIIAGNILYLVNDNSITGKYYSGSVKIRSNSFYYDRLHLVLGNLISSVEPTDTLKLDYRSYHSEDHYVFEVNISSPSKERVVMYAGIIRERINSDTMISNYFYQRFNKISGLINQNKKAIEILNQEYADEKNINGELEFRKTALMLNDFNLESHSLNIKREFDIYPFSESDITIIESSALERLLKINLVFLVLGIFISISIRELKNPE